jgi:hypothetical protein
MTQRVPNYQAMANQLMGWLGDATLAPARAYMAQAPKAPSSMGLLGDIHNAIDPVQAFGGYGGLAAMALPPGGPTTRLYHGTTNSELRAFNPKHSGEELGPHLGTADQANRRIGGEFAVRDNPYQTPSIVPLNARFKNPLELDDPFLWSANNPAMHKALEKAGFTKAEISNLKSPSDIKRLLTSKGYDAIKYRNKYEGGKGEHSYIPLVSDTVENALTRETMF